MGSSPTPGTMDGETLEKAPPGFVPPQQWPEYKLSTDIPPFLAPRTTGKDPLGSYRRFWPIVIEEYVSDKEPVMTDSDPDGISPNRMIIWQRVFEKTVPPGWRVLTQRPPRLEGISELKDAYWKAWSESARRSRRKWHEQYLGKDYRVEEISVEDFIKAYAHSTIQPYIKKLYRGIIERKQKAGADLTIIAARHIHTNEVAAAMVTVNSTQCHGSHYLAGFIAPLHEHVPAMVGLMDHWHEKSLARGIRFLHFGLFWHKGEPDTWKGFSNFKAKFGISYISYPPALWRVARGRLF